MSIAEKLTTIAENVPKVYEAGQAVGKNDFVNQNSNGGTDFSYMFYEKKYLKELPELDTSKGTDFSFMFSGCSKVTVLPDIDARNASSIKNLFQNCSSVTQFPIVETLNPVDMSYLYYNCKLVTAGTVDASKGTNFSNLLSYCSKLETLYIIFPTTAANITSSSPYGNIFQYADNLKNLTIEGGIFKSGLNVKNNTKLTHDSLMSIINALATTTTTYTVTFGSTNLAKLTDEEKAIATTKGWTLA